MEKIFVELIHFRNFQFLIHAFFQRMFNVSSEHIIIHTFIIIYRIKYEISELHKDTKCLQCSLKKTEERSNTAFFLLNCFSHWCPAELFF